MKRGDKVWAVLHGEDVIAGVVIRYVPGDNRSGGRVFIETPAGEGISQLDIRVFNHKPRLVEMSDTWGTFTQWI